MKRTMTRTLVAGAVAAAVGGPAHALGLLDAWRSAQQADAQYRSAKFELEGSRYVIPMARSQLLPTVSINTSDTKVNGTREVANATTGGMDSAPLDYFSRSRALNVRAPLVNLDGWARLRMGESQVELAEAVFRLRGKELALRMGKAYFDLLYALDSVGLAQSAVENYREAVANATRRFRGGEGTRTDVTEAESRLDIANAQLIEARDQVEVARRALQFVTGRDTVTVRPPQGELVPAPLQPASLEAWLEKVDERSPEIVVTRRQLDVAQRDVARARAGHYPTVYALAGLSKSQNDSIVTLNQKFSQSSIGLQVTIPLYSGGYVDAAVEQSLAGVRKAEQDIEAQLAAQRVDLRRQYLATANGLAKIEAYSRAVRSSELAVESTRGGVRAGLRTNLDVLDALRQAFQARRDLAQARYQYMLALLQLKAVAGEPLDEVVGELNRILERADAGPARAAVDRK